MSLEAGESPVLRAVRQRARPDPTPKGFRYSVILMDDTHGTALAQCHVCGQLLHKAQVIETVDGLRWSLRPNRKIMPSSWTLADPGGQDVLVLDQRVFGKLASPLSKVGMTISNPAGEVLCRVIEPDASLPERLLGPDPDAWRVASDAGTVALIATLSKSDRPASGWRGRLQRFVQGTDRGLVSLGETHLFDPPRALAILMIFRELRDITHSVE